MSKFSAPVDKLVQETRCYLDAQLDNVKLRSVKGLSQGTAAITGLLLIFIVAGAMATVLFLALVLWLGELLDSYALAALITAAILLLILVVLFRLRGRIFRNSFVSMYTEVFYENEARPAHLDNMDNLDAAIARTESLIQKEKAGISHAFSQAQEFYSPKRIVSGFRWSAWVIPAVRYLLRKIRK